MPAVLIQYVSKPKPGGDLAAIIQMSKEAAALWRKHGGEVSYWSVIGGEVGNLALLSASTVLRPTGARWRQCSPIRQPWNGRQKD